MRQNYRFPILTVALAVICATVSNGMAEERVADPAKFLLKEASWKQVQQFAKQQKNKVVVVDLWSTSCLPCIKEFPGLVKLKMEHGKKIACVSLNLDYAGIKSKPPAHYRPVVEKFLRSRISRGKVQPGGLTNFLCTQEAVEILDELEVGAMPVVLVYRNGKLIKRFDDTQLKPGQDEAFNYKDDIAPYIASLLKSGS